MIELLIIVVFLHDGIETSNEIEYEYTSRFSLGVHQIPPSYLNYQCESKYKMYATPWTRCQF